MLSENDVLKRGIIQNVPLTLDDGDEHYPSGHWKNTSGTRMYSEHRVKLSEELKKKFKDGHYYHNDAELINSMCQPVSEPFIIIDYRVISYHIDYSLTKEINLLRISHPFLGRMPGTEKKEVPLVSRALINIANYSNPLLSISTIDQLHLYIESLTEDAKHIFQTPWPSAIVRKQILRQNIFGGKSPKAALKILKVLSLIHSRDISVDLFEQNNFNLVEFLVNHPLIRIDHKVEKPVL
jgi:hypothetical protein